MDKIHLSIFPETVDPSFLLKIALIAIALMALNLFVARFVMIIRKVPWEAQHPILFLMVVSYLATIIPPVGLLFVGYSWYRVFTA